MGMIDFIGLEGYEVVRDNLSQVFPSLLEDAVDALNKYLINVFRNYPPYKYVPYGRAYHGKYGGFLSDRQRKYVMANIRAGNIRPGVKQRTGFFRRSWKVIGHGTSSMIVNETPYGQYLMGDHTRAAMPKMIGWETISEVVKNHEKKIIQVASEPINKRLKELGLT